MGWSGSDGKHLGSYLTELLLEGAEYISPVLYEDNANIWYIMEAEGVPVICLTLAEYYDSSTLMCKDLSENMGPSACDCPLELLDKAPEQDAEWRDRVRQYHKEREAKDWPTGSIVVHVPVREGE